MEPRRAGYPPPVELTTLRQFIALARTGHMTRAARSLGLTQPALSASLRKLEAETGAPLVHRTGRGLELTEAGRTFLKYAEEAVRRADDGVRAVRELVGLHAGSIRVGGGATVTTYLLPRVVSAVRAAHPGLRFSIREAGSSAVAAAVSSGELDLGIVTLPIKGPDAEELVKSPLVEDELRLIVPGPGAGLASGNASRARGRASAAVGGTGAAKMKAKEAAPPALARLPRTGAFRWKDLEGVPIVAFEAGTAVRELIDRAAASAGVSLDVVMELRSIESIKRMVAMGIGAGFVSKFAVGEGEGMVCRESRLGRMLAVVRRRDRTPSAAVAAFEAELRRQT